MATDAWDPMPLARAVLADPEAPLRALLAAWKALYRGDAAELTELAMRAARLSGGDGHDA
ncbi:MAG: hypothetical protein NUW01_01725 [Gemmatimonadaceae bacterium]|nr:hypothetical protein [Gemmatimonadaceae bacterium]